MQGAIHGVTLGPFSIWHLLIAMVIVTLLALRPRH